MPKLHVLPALLLLVACGDDGDTVPADATAGGSDSAIADAAPDAPATSVEMGHLVDLGAVVGSGSAAPLAGAEVCIDGQPNGCTFTDNDGDYSITVVGIPGDLQFGVHASADGHLATTYLGTSSVTNGIAETTWPSGFGLFSDAQATAFFTAAGFTYPSSTTGYLGVIVGDGNTSHGLAGATVALVGSSAAPVYADGSGTYDPTLTATVSGDALFGNLPAGPVGIVVTAPGKTCAAAQFAWPGSGSAAATATIDVGTLTDEVIIRCQ